MKVTIRNFETFNFLRCPFHSLFGFLNGSSAGSWTNVNFNLLVVGSLVSLTFKYP